MEVLKVLLMFLTVSGHSYILQPNLTVTEFPGPDSESEPEMWSEQLSNVSSSVKPGESTERRGTDYEEQGNEELTPVLKPPETTKTGGNILDKFTADFANNTEGILDNKQGHENGSQDGITAQTSSIITGAETEEDRREDGLHLGRDYESKPVEAITTDSTQTWQEEGKDDETSEHLKESPPRDKVRQTVEEEMESKLVAGINLPQNIGDFNGGDDMDNADHRDLVEEAKEDHTVVSILTPHLGTSSTRLGKEFEIPTTVETITEAQNPPPVHHHNAPPPTQVPSVSSYPPTPHVKAGPYFSPLFATQPENATTMNKISESTSEVRSDLSLQSLLAEVLPTPGKQFEQNEREVKSGSNSEDVMVKNMLLQPAWKGPQTTREVNTVFQPDEAEFIPTVDPAKPTPKEEKFTSEDLSEPNPTPKSNENNPTAKPLWFTHSVTKPTGNAKTVDVLENGTELTVRHREASLPNPQQLTPDTISSVGSMKVNRNRGNKAIKKSKNKDRKKHNKTQKLPEKKVITPTHFPYFMDNYCPSECACYGRVVQCSDKGVERVPYGIPYNSRYILLMNNQINSIQLDLLNQYVSMEFLVLTNNRLTDSSIEGAFEAVPALKRLYLDKNLLESLPMDLPVSLEELRLDDNQLSVMSEAVWTRCPGLSVLSLSNNSLGNGSESLPDAVLSPLCNLRALNLDHNQLTSVPLGLPLSIKELYLRGNLIRQFRGGAFNGRSELLVLDLSANRLTNRGLSRESLRNATSLESLNLEGNRLKQVPRHLPHSLKTLNLEGNLISSIKKTVFSTLKNLEHLGLARNKIVKVAPGAFKTLPALHQLDLCYNTLHQVPRQLPQALHTVALTHNRIGSVPRDAFCWGGKSPGLSRLVRVQLEHNLIDMGKLDAHAFKCLRGFQVVHFY